MSDHDSEFLGSQFGLEIDGVELARFTAVSGLGYESEVVTFQDTLADGKVVTRKRPGRISFPDIVLKRGLSADNALVDWYQTVIDGAVERKSGSVVIYDQTSTELGRWNFENAWISKWSASDLDAGTDDIMIEEITISHEYMERA
ncbi:MAG: phage tail protein [Actinobacteria bacterium]|nr:phage tail protein [Actinomycetota bacterium]